MINQYTTLPFILPKQDDDDMFVTVVANESAVYMHPVRSGSTGFFISPEQKKFWLKSTNKNGLPEPLRRFSYTEDVIEEPSSQFLNKKDFNEFRDQLFEDLDKFRDDIYDKLGLNNAKVEVKDVQQ